ncbi:putative hydro-lyase [Nitratireductor luteus]|uniref:putative hydro-lyase n=1 Tax=Nitratireductor luteus TaxID=2976980 RepID=UPI002240BA18|nr:putative hydro-lyase [Nitratireductor luteus]
MLAQRTRASDRFSTAVAVRHACRTGAWSEPTSGLAQGYQQGNLVILPAAYADDFLRFCVRNPKPAPVLGVSEPGDPSLPGLGEEIDIRHDLPRYRVFRNGETAETVSDLDALWRDDFVSFVLGCSFSFETALLRAGIPVRHIDAGRNVAMYLTNIETASAGPFGGPMVVSMRPFQPQDAIRAVILSAQMPQAHGAPVHLGNPGGIGIADLMKPDFGDAPVIHPGDVPVFWACGVTPQSAIRLAKPAIAITHEPGHMLVTDLRTDFA